MNIRNAAAALAVHIFFALPVAAKLCGDDVDGADVACACGDIVVSDLVLGDGDPVTSEVCDGDGLILRAASLYVITVNLAGQTLRGNGRGHGILVMYGGDRGARVISSPGRATLAGFDSGVVCSGTDLQLLEGIDVRDVATDGVRVRGPGLQVRDVVVNDAGRDGFAFSGREYRSINNRSHFSARHGFMIMGHEGILSGNRATDSGGAGFLVSGADHAIDDCHAVANGKNGLEVVAGGVAIERCTVEWNGANGIEGHGARWRLADNVAQSNGGDGIRARGVGMVDAGGNRGSGNGYLARSDAVQCLIGGEPCSGGDAP